MRIIAGDAKGRRLGRPPSGTRPFMDRNREALFSSLGSDIVGVRVLDLFAGVGTLGLEALSRGAGSATFVERGPAAVAILRENIRRVGLGGTVVAADVMDFLEGASEMYDLAFVDPPYDAPLSEVHAVLGRLADRLSDDAVVVVHRRAGDTDLVPPETLELAWDRKYGDARVMRFTKVAGGRIE